MKLQLGELPSKLTVNELFGWFFHQHEPAQLILPLERAQTEVKTVPEEGVIVDLHRQFQPWLLVDQDILYKLKHQLVTTAEVFQHAIENLGVCKLQLDLKQMQTVVGEELLCIRYYNGSLFIQFVG